jgi:hypothetical protein
MGVRALKKFDEEGQASVPALIRQKIEEAYEDLAVLIETRVS